MANETKLSTLWTIILMGVFPIAVTCLPNLYENPQVAGSITAIAIFVVALLMAFFYIIKEYTKEYAWAYKTFIYCYALGQLVAIVNYGYGADKYDPFAIALLVITLGLIIVLSLVKDFGKVNSLILCVVILILTVGNLIIDSFLFASEDLESTLSVIRVVTSLVLASLLTLMTMAKYANKEERGTK